MAGYGYFSVISSQRQATVFELATEMAEGASPKEAAKTQYLAGS